MARLIDYAAQCSCGKLIDVSADLDKQELEVTVQPAGQAPVRKTAQLPKRGPGRPPADPPSGG